MAKDPSKASRRRFLAGAGGALLSGLTAPARAAPSPATGGTTSRRLRYALIGTGHRGTGMWGSDVQKGYADVVEFVGLCDPNPKRAEASRQLIGASCPIFTSFDELCEKARPELVGVTTIDAHHAEYIVKGLDRGLRVLTEK